MAKAGRPVPGSRAETLLSQLLDEVKGLRADLRRTDDTPAELDPIEYEAQLLQEAGVTLPRKDTVDG